VIGISDKPQLKFLLPSLQLAFMTVPEIKSKN